MLEIFTFLSNSLQGSNLLAVFGAFMWGIASILLSPCHLSSIPLIIGFIGGRKDVTLKKAFLLSLLFALGILITIILVGVFTSIAGRMLGDLGSFGNIFLSVFFILFGLILLDVIKMPDFIGIKQPNITNKGYFSVFIVGLVFGVGLGPCTFAFMAPMLGIVFEVSSGNFIFGVSLLLAFAVGHSAVIVLAGTFTEVVQKYLNLADTSKTFIIIKKICGVLVIFAGIYNFFK